MQGRGREVGCTCIKDTNTVVGYHTLSNGTIMRADVVPKKAQRNSPDQHPITILGRMGVCKTLQGTGLSLDLLQDAVLRALTASEKVASTALVVHPPNDRLVGLYEKAGVLRSPQLSAITMMLRDQLRRVLFQLSSVLESAE